MEKKTKISVIEQLDYNLRIPSLYRKTWIIIGMVTLFILLLAAVPLMTTLIRVNQQIINALIVNSNLVLVAQIMSYVAFGLIAIPYVFLMACWVVGIDNVTKSKYFHLSIWIIYTLSSSLSIIAIIISFRAYVM